MMSVQKSWIFWWFVTMGSSLSAVLQVTCVCVCYIIRKAWGGWDSLPSLEWCNNSFRQWMQFLLNRQQKHVCGGDLTDWKNEEQCLRTTCSYAVIIIIKYAERTEVLWSLWLRIVTCGSELFKHWRLLAPLAKATLSLNKHIMFLVVLAEFMSYNNTVVLTTLLSGV